MARTNAAAPEDAYERLRSQIVTGALMPNERLVEIDLADRLGVGRAAIRTFLTRLEEEGLVVREPNRGARVRMVTEAEAIEIAQTRMMLESLVAREAAIRATRDEVAEMRTILAEMGQRLAAGELLLYSDGNARLHAVILRASRHATAARLISSLKAQTVRFQYRTVLVPGRPQHSYAEHTAIVEAIDAGDADAAEAAMRTHLSHVTTTLRESHAQQ